MFFKDFPKVEYDFNRTGVLQKMVDLFRSVRPLPTFLDDFSAYKFYEIKNGERPDLVSGRLYDTSKYYWTFFLINDHLHDGYRAWPMSQEGLQNYMTKEYNGFAIETQPLIVQGFANSLAGRFTMGETVTGSISGATGTVTKKNVDMSQLIVQNATGTFVAPEAITGGTSTDSISSKRVYKYIDAPYYYYKTTDPLKKPVTNSEHIGKGTLGGSVDHGELSFISNRAYLEETNDNNAKIRYVDPAYINRFASQFRDLINR